MRPINYLQNFDNNPINTLQNNLAGNLRNQANAFNLQQAKQGAEQQAQYDLLKQQALETGDYSKLNPQDQQAFMQTQAMKQQLVDKDAGRTAFGILRALQAGDSAAAKSIIANNADDINALGDPMFTVDSASQLVDADPEQLARMSQGIMQLTGFNAGADKPVRTAAQSDFEFVKNLSPEDRELYERVQRGETLSPEEQLKLEENKADLKVRTTTKVEQAKANVKAKSGYAERARAANRELSTINKLKSINKKAFSGTGAGVGLAIAKAAKTVGLEVDGLSESEQFQALANSLVLDKSQQMSGALSNADMEFLRNTAPTLTNTKEGRLAMLEYAEKLAKREQETNRLANKYRTENGSFDDAEFQVEMQKYAEENPLFESTESEVDLTKLSIEELQKMRGDIK